MFLEKGIADGLARLGHGKDYGIHIFDQPPPEIASVIDVDISGLVSSRRCSI